MPLRYAYGLALTLFWCVIGVTSSQSTASYRWRECPFTTGRTIQIDCGTLIVPENYDFPDRTRIELDVAILRHPGRYAQDDPIIYLEGGPGGSVMERLVSLYQPRFSPMFNANRDIILFDQRGVGLNRPALDCRSYHALRIELIDYQNRRDTLTAQGVSEALRDAIIRCGDYFSQSIDLSQYNSANSARDIEALRIALRLDTINLWGISYGTRLALTMMRDYPTAIRSVVLDSVYPPDVNLYTENGANFVRSLDYLFSACEEEITCQQAYPNLQEVFYETVTQLDNEPIRIDTGHPSMDVVYRDVLIDGTKFTDMIFQLLYDTQTIPLLPYIITATAQGNYHSLEVITGSIIANRSGISDGFYFAVQCHEEISFIERGSIANGWLDYPVFKNYSELSLGGELIFDICETFPVGQASPIENQPVYSNIPTLILAGAFDPVTPPAWGQHASTTLPLSRFIELPAHGHGVTGRVGCGQAIAGSFFREPSAQLPLGCIRNLRLRFTIVPSIEDNAAPDSASSRQSYPMLSIRS